MAARTSGVRALRHTGTALAVLLLILATNIIDGSAQVLLLLVADEQLDLGEGGYGLLTAVTGIGALGAVVVNRRMAAGPRPRCPCSAAVAAAGLGYALLGVVEVAPMAVVLLALVSGATVVVEVVSVTILQRSVPPTTSPASSVCSTPSWSRPSWSAPSRRRCSRTTSGSRRPWS